jgi:exopolysaccharide production protein ExoZ
MADQSRSGFNPCIHGARGLFCLMVVFYHIWNSGLPRGPVPEALNQIMESFRYGVELFFAISGYVIFITMRPVLSGRKTPLDFILNRATRIFPVLWVTILVFLPMGIYKGEGRIAEQLLPLWSFGLTLIGNLLALGPVWPVPVLYGVAWTISYEFTFYALCFAYLAGRSYLGRDLRLPVILIGLALIALHPRALFFLSGILVAQGIFDHGPLRRLATWPLLWLTLFLTAWHILSADQSPFFPAMTAWTTSFHWPLALVAFSALTLCIAGIARGQGTLCSLLTTAPLHWLGTISYSLYLWHLIILGVTKFAMAKLGLTHWAGGGAQLVLAVIALPSSLFIAHLSQFWLEQRLTTWLRQLTAVQFNAAPPFAHKQRP